MVEEGFGHKSECLGQSNKSTLFEKHPLNRIFSSQRKIQRVSRNRSSKIQSPAVSGSLSNLTWEEIASREDKEIANMLKMPYHPEEPKPNWFEEALMAYAEKGTDFSLDIIYDSVIDLCHLRMYDKVNQILKDCDVSSTPTDILLGLLISSKPYRAVIPNWLEFRTLVAEEFKIRNIHQDVIKYI